MYVYVCQFVANQVCHDIKKRLITTSSLEIIECLQINFVQYVYIHNIFVLDYILSGSYLLFYNNDFYII